MNRPKLKQISIATFVSLGMLSTSSIAANDIVKIDGSSTVYPITEAVAEEFQIATRIKVTVGVSGTGGGFKKFCRGETAVSNASRPIKLNEIKRCKESGIKFIELPIAYDALSVVINKKNDWAKEMTLSELKKMWEPAAQGKIMKWNQIRAGWPDKPLRLYGPGADSGTFDYFTEAVIEESKAIRGDFTASEDDNVLVKGVSGDKGGIAYFGLAYYEENKNLLSAVAIKNSTGNFVLPSLKTIMNGSYNPLSRPLFIYLNAEKVKSDPNVKKFVEFYLKYAAELSKEVGYVPFSKEEYAAITNHYKTLQTGSAYKEPKIGLSVKEILELSAANN
ncbi:MAG: PstS family phosphate ABC transporter substrate-binding protein [Nitrosomonadales bacterium]|jgi:phosphate transport system substrate-binding protein|nr:PstS family phosphate ABC transporter substrate-binding protein [Nitrosomonadales bacterium]MBT6818637.1 PstS family phosphate ABC transporter substrate-binding protein [Nitrosomonadales bacterium]MBT7121156.1 PstS family phosphate ABC transporter substrate-binding protein [Nitrosomonadales bacterium]